MAWRCGALAARCRCEKCGHDDVAHIEFKTIPQAIRDLNLWEQPCFSLPAPFRRCGQCDSRRRVSPRSNAETISWASVASSGSCSAR